LVGGIAAVTIALVSALFALGIDGRPDDVTLTMGDPYLGAPLDTTIALALAIAIGTVGVFCLLRFWADVRARPDRSE
jgi:hypothetical protein